MRHSVPGDARRLTACARGSSSVNAEAEAAKHDRDPVAARSPGELVPFAIETCGAFGKTAHSSLRLLPFDFMQHSRSEEPCVSSLLIGRWAVVLAATLHKANARAVSFSAGSGAARNLVAGSIS